MLTDKFPKSLRAKLKIVRAQADDGTRVVGLQILPTIIITVLKEIERQSQVVAEQLPTAGKPGQALTPVWATASPDFETVVPTGIKGAKQKSTTIVTKAQKASISKKSLSRLVARATSQRSVAGVVKADWAKLDEELSEDLMAQSGAWELVLPDDPMLQFSLPEELPLAAPRRRSSPLVAMTTSTSAYMPTDSIISIDDQGLTLDLKLAVTKAEKCAFVETLNLCSPSPEPNVMEPAVDEDIDKDTVTAAPSFKAIDNTPEVTTRSGCVVRPRRVSHQTVEVRFSLLFAAVYVSFNRQHTVCSSPLPPFFSFPFIFFVIASV